MTKTLVGSGLTSQTPFAHFVRESSSWKTSETTYELGSKEFSRTLPTSGSMRSGALFSQPKLEPRISVSDSSSSHGLPTPAARDWKNGKSNLHGTNSRPLNEVVLTLLPTPQANIATNGGSQHPDKRRAGGHSVSLQDVVEHLLATPRASDGEKGGPNQCNSRGQYDALPGQVHESRFQKYQAAVDRWTAVYGHEPPTPTLPDGRGGNHRLNPSFSQWMMGAMHVHLEPLDRKQRLQAIGNAVQPQTAHAAYSQLLARKDAQWTSSN